MIDERGKIMKKRRIRISLIILVGVLLIILLEVAVASGATLSFPADEGHTVEFRLGGGLIFIPATIDGEGTGYFYLSTGCHAGWTIHSKINKVLGLEKYKTRKVIDERKRYKEVSYKLGSMDFAGHRLESVFFRSSSETDSSIEAETEQVGFPVWGWISTKIIDQFLVEINFDRMTVTFSDDFPDRGTYSNPESGPAFIREADFLIPFSYYRERINISVGLNDLPQKANMRISTGTRVTKVALEYIEKIGTQCEKSIGLQEEWLETRYIAASGPYTAKIKKAILKKLSLENLTIENFPLIVQKGTTYYSRSTKYKLDGELGMDFLSRFNITFDFKNKFMILNKNRKYHELAEGGMRGE